jgi:hypothetical protein
MLRTLAAMWPADSAMPARTHRLLMFRRVLDGTLYDALPYEFHEERTGGGEYIPLRMRRPSVRYALARVVVEDAVGLLFGDGRFPRFISADAAVQGALARLAGEMRLGSVMTEAALRGSVGSVALHLRVLGQRPFVDVLESAYLTPEWDTAEPDRLVQVVERYKVPGSALLAAGQGAEAGETYWFQRRFTAEEEQWFLPQPVGEAGPMRVDPGRSVRHGLGFVPVVWIKNLPGGEVPDGGCTFAAAVETGIEIDYQLSQAGRALKYSADPTLLIREPAGIEGELVRGAGNALVLSERGDAKLLEIGGGASAAVLDYVRFLRELALEGIHGNRADPQRLGVPASGRAMEMMQQGLLWLAGNLRVSYGEGGLVPLARMLLRAHARYPLRVGGAELAALDAEAGVGLAWQPWETPGSEERARDAGTLKVLGEAGLLSRESAVRMVAEEYGLADAEAELRRIEKEQQGAATPDQSFLTEAGSSGRDQL